MATEIKVPTLGESVTEATVIQWFKAEGDVVAVDEPLLELETDKVTLEVNATAAGTLREITAKAGENVDVGSLLGLIGAGPAALIKPKKTIEESAAPTATTLAKPASTEPVVEDDSRKFSPSVRKLIEENNLDSTHIIGTGINPALRTLTCLTMVYS